MPDINFLTIIWYIEIIAIVIAIIASFYFYKALKNLKIDPVTKEVLIYLAITSFLVTTSAALIITFGLMKIDITKKWWLIFILIYFILVVVWFVGCYKFMGLAKQAREDENA